MFSRKLLIGIIWWGNMLLCVPVFSQWVSLNHGTNIKALSFLYFTDENVGYVLGAYTPTGSENYILKTIDGGGTWSSYKVTEVNDTLSIGQIFFSSDQIGYVTFCDLRWNVIQGDMSRTAILKTTDAGGIWQKVYSDSGNGCINKIVFVNDSTGYAACDYYRILKTTDGGYTWTVQEPGVGPLGSYWLFALSFPNDSIGYAGGGYFGLGEKVLYKTVDRGNTWSKIIDNPGVPFGHIFFVNDTLGYGTTLPFTGSNSVILKTSDGGFTWATKKTFSGVAGGIFFLDIDTGYVVGENGVILRTDDGGDTWVTQVSGTTEWLSGISFPSSQVGYIAGGGNMGVILKTTNGGGMWIREEKFQQDMEVIIYPNPFRDKAILRVTGDKGQGTREFIMYDLLGREVTRSVILSGAKNLTIHRNNLPGGMYFYKVMDREKVLATGKIVIQ